MAVLLLCCHAARVPPVCLPVYPVYLLVDDLRVWLPAGLPVGVPVGRPACPSRSALSDWGPRAPSRPVPTTSPPDKAEQGSDGGMMHLPFNELEPKGVSDWFMPLH